MQPDGVDGDASASRGVARPARLSPLSAVLGAVLQAREPVSRAQIAASLGLSRGTVSGIADQLLSSGLVRELDPVLVGRAGRPAVPLAGALGTVAALGMEVNVDYYGLRAVDLAGRVLFEQVVDEDLRGSDPEVALGRLADLAGRVILDLQEAGLRVAGTALALPGLVNRVTGPLRYAPNLGWRDVDVVRLMSRHPVLAAFPPSLANEANLAARAEAWARRGRVAPSFFYVSGELGIGGAIVLEGEIFAGRHGWSGEIGHVVVEPALGAERGGLEALAGQALMLRAAGMPAGATIADLAAAAERGEAQPLAAVRDAGRMLGTALAAAANILDIGEVVLGGSFGQLFDHLHGQVEDCLQQMVIFAPWSTPAVTRARAGELPAMAGGALTVLRGVVDDAEAWVA